MLGVAMSSARTYVVGREPGCDVRLHATGVSRRHAEVTLLPNGRICVTDCESTNGTFVLDGGEWHAVRQAAYLEPGDEIRFGECRMSAARLEALCRGGADSEDGSGGGPAFDDSTQPEEVLRDLYGDTREEEPPERFETLAPGTKLEDFKIERVLGSGGFGVTYLVRDESLRARRALKEYLPREWGARGADGGVGPRTEADAESYRWGLEKFLSEARMLAKFDHGNIVRVYRVFPARGTAYMVTEYVEGRTLSAEVEVTGLLPESSVRGMLSALMDGLKKVHAVDALHRDIKPDNVMVRPDGTPVLIDFGAARQAMGRQSRSRVAVVSPGFAPLEQYSAGGNQGAWTDIYALGAVAYWALSGHVPEDATERAREDPLPSLAAVAPAASPELAAAVDRALAVNVEDRPRSLDEWQAQMVVPDGRRRPLLPLARWRAVVPLGAGRRGGLGRGGVRRRQPWSLRRPAGSCSRLTPVQAFCGGLVGGAQYWVLRRRLSRAGWWVACHGGGLGPGRFRLGRRFPRGVGRAE